MTFGHYTADTNALTAVLQEVTRRVTRFTNRFAESLFAHHWGGTPPWPVPPERGPFRENDRPDYKRITGDRKKRKARRRLHTRLRKMGRNKTGRPK